MPSWSEEKKKTKIASSHEEKIFPDIKILKEKKRKIASSHEETNISSNENIKR